MRIVPLCAATITFLFSLTAAAQTPTDGTKPEPQKPAEGKKVGKGEAGAQPFGMLKVEADPALNGDEFKNEEWGIEMRLPRGFKPIDAAQLEAIRKATIPPESERVLPSGNIQKKQVFVFDDGIGGRILLDAYDPPLQIGSPVQLRQLILTKAREGGQKMEEAGKPLMFQARGNRRGSLTEFDSTLPDGRIVHQLVAAIRAGNRSFLFYGTTEQSKFLDYEKMFQQSLTTIALATDASEIAEAQPKVESRRFEGMRNVLTIAFNLAILGIVVLACLRLKRSSPEVVGDPA